MSPSTQLGYISPDSPTAVDSRTSSLVHRPYRIKLRHSLAVARLYTQGHSRVSNTKRMMARLLSRLVASRSSRHMGQPTKRSRTSDAPQSRTAIQTTQHRTSKRGALHGRNGMAVPSAVPASRSLSLCFWILDGTSQTSLRRRP